MSDRRKYGQWFRLAAGEAVRAWIERCKLPQVHVARYFGVCTTTVRRLENGGKPGEVLTDRLVTLGVLDSTSAAPNLKLADKLSALRGKLPAARGSDRAEYGVAGACRRYRARNGEMSQDAFAEQLGAHKATVAQWERGETLPDPSLLVELVRHDVVERSHAERLLDDVYPSLVARYRSVDSSILGALDA